MYHHAHATKKGHLIKVRELASSALNWGKPSKEHQLVTQLHGISDDTQKRRKIGRSHL